MNFDYDFVGDLHPFHAAGLIPVLCKAQLIDVGYSSRYNEWRSLSELVDKSVEVDEQDASSSSFLHQELAYRSSRVGSKCPLSRGGRAKAREVDYAVKGNNLTVHYIKQ